ncbi:MAG: hypothetical protein IJA07_05655 [Agathobacter sp.]|nr:hypothetical protein [Agathobacter sp.]MBQ3558973.1 hypothetical protein [Agathobacter sp.]
MSQAKVDQYKKEKANRKETMAKEKRQKMIIKICSSAVLVVLVAWIGVSTADYIYDNRPQDTVYVETTEIDNYLESLYEEETTEK